MTDEPQQPTTTTNVPADDDEEPEGRGGGDGKSKALGTPGLGDRGRTNANEQSDD